MTSIVYLGLALYVAATGLYLFRLFRAGAQIERWANFALVSTIVLWLGIFAGLGMFPDWSVTTTQRWLWASAWMLSLVFAILRRRFAIDGAGGGELMEIVGGREGAGIGLESDP